MSPREITSVAFKFFAIYLLINIVLEVPSMIMLIASPQYAEKEFSSIAYLSVVGAFILLVVLVSWVLGKLANSIVSNVPDRKESTEGISQTFLLQVLGLFFIVNTLSFMPGYIMLVYKLGGLELTNLMSLSAYLFQLVVGVYLLIKPSVWSGWLNVLRGRA